MSFWHTPQPQEHHHQDKPAHSEKAPKVAKKRAAGKKKGR